MRDPSFYFDLYCSLAFLGSLIVVGFLMVNKGQNTIRSNNPNLMLNQKLFLFLVRIFKGIDHASNMESELLLNQDVQKHGRAQIGVGAGFIIVSILILLVAFLIAKFR